MCIRDRLAGYLDFQTSYEAAKGLEAEQFWLYEDKLIWRSIWQSKKDLEDFREALASQFISRYPEAAQQSFGEIWIIKTDSLELEIIEKGRELEISYKAISS